MALAGVQDRTRWWNREDVLLILLLGALLYLPGLGAVPLFDRDEPRFASAAQGMMATGDYVVPRFNGQLRPDKPPLVYWAMCLTYQVAGGELGARLPSAVFGTLTMVVVYFAAGARFGRVTGMLSALLLGSCALFVVESRLATADATMVFFTTLAMACAWRAWDAGSAGGGGPGATRILPRAEFLVERGPHGRGMLDHVGAGIEPGPVPLGVALAFWVALALGVLAKGVPLLFVGLPMAVLSIATAGVWRQWKEYSWGARVYHFPEFLARGLVRGNWGWWRGLRPLIGAPILIVLVGAWGAAAWVATGGELIKQMVEVHFLVRVAGPLLQWLGINLADHLGARGQDPMRAYTWPPGFYLVLLWVTFWPWSVLVIPAAFHGIKRMLGRTVIAIDPRPYLFLAVWIVPMWVALELARGKLMHYVLPLYVPLAILCADMLVQGWHRLSDVMVARWVRAARWVWAGIWFILAGAVLGFTYYLVASPAGEAPHGVFWLSMPLAGALAATGVAGAIAWNRPGWPFVTVLGWGMALAILNATVLPDMPELQVSKQALADVRTLERQGFVAGAAGYEEPSLVFYNGGRLALKGDPPGLAAATNPAEAQALIQAWDAKWNGIWKNEAKHPAEERETFGSPGVATVLVVNDAELQAIRKTGAKVWVYAQFEGFRTDNLEWLRQAWGRLWGREVKPLPVFRVSVVTNKDWLPPVTTQAASTPATSAATDAEAPPGARRQLRPQQRRRKRRRARRTEPSPRPGGGGAGRPTRGKPARSSAS